MESLAKDTGAYLQKLSSEGGGQAQLARLKVTHHAHFTVTIGSPLGVRCFNCMRCSSVFSATETHPLTTQSTSRSRRSRTISC
eukprot:5090433-Amphidinium_carterae.1